MKILVTGGAGFIGSHIVSALLKEEGVELVRVLDNLSTGHKSNIEEYFSDPRFEFITGDIRSAEDCYNAAQGIDIINHQAALGSVPRSIKDPSTTHDVNLNGFLNILNVALKLGIKKIVYASSSSVYGNLPDSPKVEDKIGKLLSPYAVTKLANELYAEAYSRQYGIQFVGFRYFNVFGPKQDPEGPYAAVIPLFITAALKKISPRINGDGTITRDFTYIDNVVKANLNALLKFNVPGTHEVFNIACGRTTTLNNLWAIISSICNVDIRPDYCDPRQGDIQQSLADVTKAENILEYNSLVPVEDGLRMTVSFYKNLVR